MRKTTLNECTGAGIVGRRGSRRRSSRGGFTLIELVVVIGIMLLLLGLTLSVGVAVRTQSEIRETENILRLLDTATQEWERQADRQLSWGRDGNPTGSVYDMQGLVGQPPWTAEILVITELLQTISRPSAVKQIVAQIDPDFIHTYRAGEYPVWIQTPQERTQMDMRFDGEITVLDAWGSPIYATHPGRVRDPNVFPNEDNDAYPGDQDGTVHTYNEDIYGVARNRQVCFVSAGPDGEFGFMSQADDELTKDNLYSYPVKPPQP